jgi:hypothetical protein
MIQRPSRLCSTTTRRMAFVVAAAIACRSASPTMTSPRAPTTERAERSQFTLRYQPSHKRYTVSDQATIQLETDSTPRTLRITSTALVSLDIRQLDSNTIAAHITVVSLILNGDNPTMADFPLVAMRTSTLSATISPTGQILHMDTASESNCGATSYISSIARSLLIPLLPVLQSNTQWTETFADTLCLIGITGRVTTVSNYQVTALPSLATRETIELTEESTADFHGNIFSSPAIRDLTARANRKTRMAIDTRSATLITSLSETESRIVVATATTKAIFTQHLHRKIQREF